MEVSLILKLVVGGIMILPWICLPCLCMYGGSESNEKRKRFERRL